MTALQAANAEIRRRMQTEQRRREQRRLADLPIRTVDALLAELEELHLAGRKRVPESFDARLEGLNATLPEDCRSPLRSRITIAHLMDRLYAIQDCLLSRRARRSERDGHTSDPADDDLLPQAS